MKRNFNIILVLIFLIFLSSSFDIFLSIDLFGFTFRISQIMCIILYLIYFGVLFKNKKMKLPLGHGFLMLWLCILLLFTFNTDLPKMNIGYHLWLIFNILIIYSMNQLINESKYSNKIIKLYIISFELMAIIGILQFLFGITGISTTFIKQWWIYGKIPRINAFCYEPSYYATYMIIGWTFCRELKKRNITIENINLKFVLWLLTLSIVLSSSRMGIVLIILYEVLNFGVSIFKGGNLKYKFYFIFSVLFVTFTVLFLYRRYDLSFLLGGTGINGTANHSVSERKELFDNVFDVFKASPIIGRGLGGIYTEIAKNTGHSLLVEGNTTAICVFAEVLAASGLIGFIIFIAYFFQIVNRSKIISNHINYKDASILLSLIWAMVMEIIILQFNQNILRTYFWIHLAVISMYYSNLKDKKYVEDNYENTNNK